MRSVVQRDAQLAKGLAALVARLDVPGQAEFMLKLVRCANCGILRSWKLGWHGSTDRARTRCAFERPALRPNCFVLRLACGAAGIVRYPRRRVNCCSRAATASSMCATWGDAALTLASLHCGMHSPRARLGSVEDARTTESLLRRLTRHREARNSAWRLQSEEASG